MGDVRIPFPLKGKDENWAASGQPPLTSPDLQNVRPRDTLDKRSRGGQRPGVRKIMYWWDYPGEGEDLGLPYPSPIIGLAQVTAVYYASVAGDTYDKGEDPAGGDPKWDGIVLYVIKAGINTVQAYSYSGGPALWTAGGTSGGSKGRVSLGMTNHIFVIDDLADEHLKKFDSAGDSLVEIQQNADSIMGSIKPDGLVFIGNNDTLRAYSSQDLSTILWSKTYSQSKIVDISQLPYSDDLLIAFSGDFSGVGKRVSRTDGSTIVDFKLEGYGSLGRGAASLAANGATGFGYKVGGYDPTAERHIFRIDLVNGGSHDGVYTSIIGANNKVVRTYNNKVYVAGVRADDNKTIWRFSADLSTEEASYDTGGSINDIRILTNGTIITAGQYGTTEDATTGNINIFNADLVRSDTWNIESGSIISSIGERR